MNTLLYLLLTLVLLSIMVVIHELGHFIFAKLFKVTVLEFSVGMGPAIYTTKKRKKKKAGRDDGEIDIAESFRSSDEEKLNTVTQTRYLALYRQASVGDPLFDGKTLRCQEIGQNQVRDSAVTFYTKENYLVVHTASGSRTLRMNDGLELIEANSLSYEISGILTDAEDSTKQYLRIHVPDSQTVGLADSEGNVILSPYYDGIYHAENNRFIVRLRNAFGVISYQNGKVKEMIDCQYSQLFPLGDGGYIGIDGNGHSHVYEKSRLLYDDALSYAGSGYPYEEIRVLQLDNESRPVVGYGTVINRDGKLSLHMPSAFSRQTQTSFSTKSSVLPDTVRNDIAKLRSRRRAVVTIRNIFEKRFR